MGTEVARGEMNKPVVTAAVMLAGVVTGLPMFVAAVMAYVFRSDAQPGSWEETHYIYQIRTFWGTVVGMAAGIILAVVLVGFLIMGVTMLWALVRAIVALVKAMDGAPLPNPRTWAF